MINKKTFIFNTLAEALTFKIGADPKNTTYRLGSFAEDAEIKTVEITGLLILYSAVISSTRTAVRSMRSCFPAFTATTSLF